MRHFLNFMKDIIKIAICFFIGFFIFPSKKIISKTILLIRLDAIGDYIIFRNFIEVVKRSNKYKDYKITLVGNEAWRELAEKLDGEYIEKFIWVNRAKFLRSANYRYKKLKEITQSAYEVVISPVYSREFFYGDAIVKLVRAQDKIGSVGDLSNIKKWQKKISDNYYTKLIPGKQGVLFEFYRNKEFFESLLGVEIEIQKPYITLKSLEPKHHLPQNFAILFIGASSDYRKWDVRKFASVGKWLKKKYRLDIVLCGGYEDREKVIAFKRYFDEAYVDLVGKTSLTDLLYIVNKSFIIVSNETFVPHLAVALGKKYIFVISNGNHFGRFIPYPKEITIDYYPIYHPEIEKNLGNYKKLCNTYGYVSNLNINEISEKKVIDVLDKILADSVTVC